MLKLTYQTYLEAGKPQQLLPLPLPLPLKMLSKCCLFFLPWFLLNMSLSLFNSKYYGPAIVQPQCLITRITLPSVSSNMLSSSLKARNRIHRCLQYSDLTSHSHKYTRITDILDAAISIRLNKLVIKSLVDRGLQGLNFSKIPQSTHLQISSDYIK